MAPMSLRTVYSSNAISSATTLLLVLVLYALSIKFSFGDRLAFPFIATISAILVNPIVHVFYIHFFVNKRACS
ncbi:MAG: hypothetical protein COB36_05980 [Alphaproteobacteria bacterium]|nr:MAG: hypothetical protein COB36_05980 [Alphaproteobacteria bacterium]